MIGLALIVDENKQNGKSGHDQAGRHRLLPSVVTPAAKSLTSFCPRAVLRFSAFFHPNKALLFFQPPQFDNLPYVLQQFFLF